MKVTLTNGTIIEGTAPEIAQLNLTSGASAVGGNITKTCIICDTQYTTRFAKSLCCSNTCKIQHARNYANAYNKSTRKRKSYKKTERTCIMCNVVFMASKSHAKYSSAYCSSRFYRERKRAEENMTKETKWIEKITGT